MAYYHCRSDATRSDAAVSGLANRPFDLTVAGTSRLGLVDQNLSFRIRKAWNGGPSTLECTINPGLVPVFGQDVVVTLGGEPFWGGSIVAARSVISGFLVRTNIQCVDWTWRMDSALRVTRRFVNEPVNSAVARILVDSCASGDGIKPGYMSSSLGTVSLEFDGALVSEAIGAIAGAVGAGWRIRADKHVDVFTLAAPFPWGSSLTLVNGSSAMELTHAADGRAVRTRTVALGRSTKTLTAITSTVTTVDVEDVSLFNAGGGTARVGLSGSFTYAAVSGASLTGVSALTEDHGAGDEVRPMVTANDGAAQTALAAVLGRSGIVEHVIEVDGDHAACASAAAADVALYKEAIPAVSFVQHGALARFYEAGQAVEVTLSTPITVSTADYVVQSVEVTPGETLSSASVSPRLLARVEARVVRHPELTDMFVLQR